MNLAVGGAAIALVTDEGVGATVWNTNKHAGRTCEQMLRAAHQADKLHMLPATYMVAWTNMSGIPSAQLFTVTHGLNGGCQIKQGLGITHRVNRWPPKA